MPLSNPILSSHEECEHAVSQYNELSKNEYTSLEKLFKNLFPSSKVENYDEIATIQDGHIIGLDLKQKQLLVVPNEIQNFSYLQTLDLSNNQIALIPKWITTLQNLKILKVTRNRLSGLPEEIAELNKLEVVNLFSNKLTYLPENIGSITSFR